MATKTKMITGLFEAHLFVENLERSIHFYKNVLGLEQCYYDDARRAAFFWPGKPKESMLGLWEKPKHEITTTHIAFRCDKEDVLNRATDFLTEQNLKYYNFLNDGSKKPMVFAWMPALSIYFNDPDGHELEFIAILEGDARPELGIISYEDWQAL
jgi:lactoylglutathione lyase